MNSMTLRKACIATPKGISPTRRELKKKRRWGEQRPKSIDLELYAPRRRENIYLKGGPWRQRELTRRRGKVEEYGPKKHSLEHQEFGKKKKSPASTITSAGRDTEEWCRKGAEVSSVWSGVGGGTKRREKVWEVRNAEALAGA